LGHELQRLKAVKKAQLLKDFRTAADHSFQTFQMLQDITANLQEQHLVLVS
jgi:hypothetical protein